MNKVSNFTFISLMLLPALLLFFQNCAEMVSSQSDMISSHQSDNFPPILLTSSENLGFRTQSDCRELNETFYSSSSHLCFVAKNECEASFLSERGYTIDENNMCNDSVDFENFSSSTLSNKTAEDLGFEKSPDIICSQQYLEMVNLKNGHCSAARNGCEISYLESLGFSADDMNLCSF